MSKAHRRRRGPPAVVSQPLPTAQPRGEPFLEEVARLRWLWLFNLQIVWSQFWEDLNNEVWRSADPNAVAHWAVRENVKDDWFFDALRDTLAFWTAHPESPEARLDPACRAWFKWSPRGDFHLEPFELRDIPQMTMVDGKPRREPPEEFATRVRTRFDKEFKAYDRYYRNGFAPSIDYIDKHPALLRDLQLAAHRFAGTTRETLVERWPELDCYKEDPIQLITKKVRDLCDKIGLTLPPWKCDGNEKR